MRSASIAIAAEQVAQSRRRRRYRSPDTNRIPRRDHSGGGVRGCGEDIVAIAPRVSGIGQTTATRPTFVWYSQSNSAEPIEFQLYRYKSAPSAGSGAVEEVMIKRVEDSRQGYMSYTLPAESPALKVGETYTWRVVLYCDPALEEVGMWTSADIEIVTTPTEIDDILLNGDSPSEALTVAQAFANSGLWYDAIAAVYQANTLAEADFRQDLLKDLLELEGSTDSAETEDVIDQLQQVLATASVE